MLRLSWQHFLMSPQLFKAYVLCYWVVQIVMCTFSIKCLASLDFDFSIFCKKRQDCAEFKLLFVWFDSFFHQQAAK